MGNMKNGFIAASTIFLVFLSACSDDKPSEEMAAKTVRPFAEQNLLPGMEITDYKRDNGWIDTDAPNRYKVQYVFNYALKKPLAEVVLEFAKQLQDEVQQKKKTNAGFMGIEARGAEMAITMAATEFIKKQGDNFADRRDKFVGGCEPCVAYWNEKGSKDEVSTRRYTFLLAWAAVEDMGFKDDAKVGDKVGRSAWAAFNKTEKGWQPAS